MEEISIETNPETLDLWCSLSSSDSHYLIGKDGDVILSITHLLKKILEKRLRGTELADSNFILDINGYHKKNIESIHSRAHMLAERVKYFKNSIEAPPMTSFERRIVHSYLSGQKNIKTESTGTGRDRRVVILYDEKAV